MDTGKWKNQFDNGKKTFNTRNWKDQFEGVTG